MLKPRKHSDVSDRSNNNAVNLYCVNIVDIYVVYQLYGNLPPTFSVFSEDPTRFTIMVFSMKKRNGVDILSNTEIQNFKRNAIAICLKDYQYFFHKLN